MNDPQPEGSDGKLHRTTKILSHARRRGSVAACGARAAARADAAHRHGPSGRTSRDSRCSGDSDLVAEVQAQLGFAFLTLGERESGTARLEQAVAAYREALKERATMEAQLGKALKENATTQYQLGEALFMLGKRESGTARLEQAVAAYRAALDVFAKAGASDLREHARRNLADAEALLAERRGKGL
jgi:tetratricopeptide (TPR) repeat protein